VIAAVGFIVGVAWPRLAGVKIGPNAPSETSAASSASGAKPTRAPEAPPASVSAKTAPVASASAAPSASAAAAALPPVVSVKNGAVLSCKTDDGETKKGKECGSVAAVDAFVVPRLKKLSQCSAAEGQTGKLSFVVNADFKSGRLGWDVGKSSNVGNVDGITGCLKTFFSGVALTPGTAHENPKYTISYHATFEAPKGEAPDAKDAKAEPSPDKGETKAKDDKPAPAEAAGGEGTIAWEVALVRDVPKTGQVVTRLPRGTKVKLGAQKDGWYAIKYGDGFASDGWVYRGALGK
jgi:hypothetical protein